MIVCLKVKQSFMRLRTRKKFTSNLANINEVSKENTHKNKKYANK